MKQINDKKSLYALGAMFVALSVLSFDALLFNIVVHPLYTEAVVTSVLMLWNITLSCCLFSLIKQNREFSRT